MSRKIAQYVSFSPLIMLVGMLAGIVLDILLPWRIAQNINVLLIVGVMLIVVGQIIMWLCKKHRALQYCNDATCDQSVGDGPYRYSRHPKYGAYILMMIGIGLIMNAWMIVLITIIVFGVFTTFVIPQQEHLLSKEFPGVYDEYKKKVPMWI
jgi:protein-S-isoprenylcysteine O-methyltransferase Ste14